MTTDPAHEFDDGGAARAPRWLAAMTVCVCVSAVIVVAVLLTTGVSATGERPTLTVSVGGTEIEPGETFTVRDDPSIRIDAEATGADARLQLVVVRIDDAIFEKFDVNTTAVSEVVSPSLFNRDYEVEVIVKDSEGNVVSNAFTLRKDTVGPFFWLTSPYDSTPRREIQDGIVYNESVTIAGRLDEPTTPIEVQIIRAHVRTGLTQSASSTYPGQNFSERLRLGTGRNKITIKAVDRLGNFRLKEFYLEFHDREPPRVASDAPATTRASEITIRITVTDNVWVNSASFRTGGYTVPNIVSPKTYKPNRDRYSVTVSRTVGLQVGNNTFTVIATDQAANKREASFTVHRERPAEYGYQAPNITIDRTRTRFVTGDTLSVIGTITGDGLTSATLRIQDAEDGETIDYIILHDGDPREEVPIDTNVTVNRNDVRLRILVEDSTGTRRSTELWVDRDRQEVGVTTETPEPTPTAAPAGTTGGPDGTVQSTETPPDTDAAPVNTEAPSGDSTPFIDPPALPGFGMATALVAFVLGLLIKRVW